MFHLHGVDQEEAVVLRRQMRRSRGIATIPGVPRSSAASPLHTGIGCRSLQPDLEARFAALMQPANPPGGENGPSCDGLSSSPTLSCALTGPRPQLLFDRHGYSTRPAHFDEAVCGPMLSASATESAMQPTSQNVIRHRGVERSWHP